MLRYLFMWFCLVALAYSARRWGGWPERCGVAILWAMAIADIGFRLIAGHWAAPGGVDRLRAGNDIFGLVAFVWLALKADRFWTLWAGGFQIMATLSHMMRATENAMLELVYLLMVRVPYWAQIVTIGLAIFLHHRRRTSPERNASVSSSRPWRKQE